VNVLLVLAAGAWLYGATLTALAAEWLSSADASYGVVIAAVAAAVAWQRRHAFARAAATPGSGAPGFALASAGLLLYLAGFLGADIFITRVSFIVVTAGALGWVAGMAALRIVAVPLVFLLLAIPPPTLIVNAITLPLQLVASTLAEGMLSLMAVPVFRDGNLLVLPSTTLQVEEACSGLRSLVSLGALSVVLAWATEQSVVRRTAIVAAAVPIAIVANGLRIAAAGLATETWGPGAASGDWHTFTGWITFVAAVAMLIATQRVLHGLGQKRRTWPTGAVAA
jgi:exosortase